MVNDLRLLAGSPVDIRVTLAVGDFTETVTVQAGSELVQTQLTSVSSTISTEQIANLPVYTRNALHVVSFLGGVDTTTGVRNSTATVPCCLSTGTCAMLLLIFNRSASCGSPES